MTVAAARPVTYLSLALVLGVAVALAGVRPAAVGSALEATPGGVVRIALARDDVDSLDPALAYAGSSWALLNTTCALLLRPTDLPGLKGSHLVPEVAAGWPRVSSDGQTYTFTLRRGFRFNDGTPVRASAFAAAIHRTLAPGVGSPWATYTGDIVGAGDVRAGRSATASGVTARGNTLVVRLKRPIPEFPHRTTSLCAVPPSLPPDREGLGAFPAAGPYYVAEYRPGERVVIERNRFYGGTREHHVDGFVVDLQASSGAEVLDRIERGEADWGWALPTFYFDPERRLAAKYGVNRSQFFVRPGEIFFGYSLNTSRPLFRDNPRLRQAVNFAIDRAALRRLAGGPLERQLTDQYLPPGMPGFKDARIYPLGGPNLARARQLARGNTRSGKAVFYTIARPDHLAAAQSIKQYLAKIGLEVQIKGVPLPAYFGRLMAQGPYDIGFATWLPDYADPYSVLNVQLDGRFIGATNWPRFDSPTYNRLLREAASLEGAARYRAYGELDVRLARDAAPMVAVAFLNDATLVSKRVGCFKRSFDLAGICLR
jgi:peptide/nickel transport system substrate-binding protein